MSDLRKFIATTIKEYLNEQLDVENEDVENLKSRKIWYIIFHVKDKKIQQAKTQNSIVHSFILKLSLAFEPKIFDLKNDCNN